MTYALTKAEVESMSIHEIYQKLSALLSYDEYEWQRKKKLKITYPKRAEGLHLPIYQCKHCKQEFQMSSEGTTLFCTSCGVKYEMDELGTLHNGEEEIYIPDWYEWQRTQVKEEIDKLLYSLDCTVEVWALPNAQNFIFCKEGRLIHTIKGFELTFCDYLTGKENTLYWSPAQCFSVHTEYNYRNKGQCITLSTLDNTYFLFPLEEGFNATKIQFATEYMYELNQLSD